MRKGSTVAAVLFLAMPLPGAVAPDDFALEIVKAGTKEQHEMELPAPGGSMNLEVLLTSHREYIQGWSLGVILQADPGATGAITSLRMGPMDVDWVPPEFEALDWYAGGDLDTVQGSCTNEDGPCTDIQAGAFTQGVVLGLQWLPKIVRFYKDVPVVEFTVTAAASPGAGDTATARLEFSHVVGNPRIDTVIVHGGLSYQPAVLTPATITVIGPIQFRRGDANGDGVVNIADPVWNFEELFRNGPPTTCEDAADADDDGMRTIGDSVSVLSYLFAGGPQPALPFPACGHDDSVDELGCLAYEPCE